jgi:hypothetical protein
MFKTVAEMKRSLTPGTVITMTYHRFPEPITGGPGLVGIARKVARTNTVDLLIETVRPGGKVVESHMRWPKRDEVLFTPRGWAILDEDGDPFMVYEITPAA